MIRLESLIPPGGQVSLPGVLGRHMAQQVTLLLSPVGTVLTAEPGLHATLHASVTTEALPVLVESTAAFTGEHALALGAGGDHHAGGQELVEGC